MKNLISAFAGIFGATMIFTSCGGGGSSGNDKGDFGPVSARSFEGSSISFNPTINFLGGDALEWINEDSSSDFPMAPASAPLIGSFEYLPEDGFRSGRLEVTLNGEQPIFFILSDFVTDGGLVQSFSMEAFGDTYTATVTRGALFAAEREGTAPPVDIDFDGNNFSFRENGNLTAGTEFTRSFVSGTREGDTSETPLIRYIVGEPVDFLIADDGSLVFEGTNRQIFGGGEQTISLPFVFATPEGTLAYRGNINSGTLVVTLNSRSVADGPPDLTMTWTRVFPTFTDKDDAVDTKTLTR